MKSSWMHRAGAVFAAAAVGIVVSAGVASADDGRVSNGTGYAKWVENGDTLTVCDEKVDERGVRGYIYQPLAGDEGNGPVLIKVSDPAKDGDCFSVSQNIAESTRISIKVCNYKGTSITNCKHKRLR